MCHWLPLFISDAAIKSILFEYGKVLSVKCLVNNVDNAPVKNGLMEVVLEVSEIERLKISHLIRFSDGM